MQITNIYDLNQFDEEEEKKKKSAFKKKKKNLKFKILRKNQLSGKSLELKLYIKHLIDNELIDLDDFNAWDLILEEMPKDMIVRLNNLYLNTRISILDERTS